jgi:hypothetical protein
LAFQKYAAVIDWRQMKQIKNFINPLIFLHLLFFVPILRAEEIPNPEAKKEEPAKVEAPSTIPMPKFNGLFQVWAFHDSTTYSTFNFRIRRAELKISGQTIPELKYFLMIDPAKGIKDGAVSKDNDNKILQDIGINYQIINGLEFQIGQFKTPTSAEGLQSAGDLLFPERAITSRTFGDKRETGAMLTYKNSDWLKVSVMGSNGGNTNTNDNNSDKDLSGRVDLKLFENLSLGGFSSYSDGKDIKTYRNGANFAAKLGNFFLNAEGATGMIDLLKSHGFYVDLGYDHQKILKPVLRYEYFVLNHVISTLYSAGINYSILDAKAKFQLSYTYMNNAQGDVGTPKSKNLENGNLVIANFQLSI